MSPGSKPTHRHSDTDTGPRPSVAPPRCAARCGAAPCFAAGGPPRPVEFCRTSSCAEHVRYPKPDKDLDLWWDDIVHPLTGDGHPCGVSEHALYEAKIVDAPHCPTLVGQVWSGERLNPTRHNTPAPATQCAMPTANHVDSPPGLPAVA